MGEKDSINENNVTAKPKTAAADGFFADEGEIFTAHWHIFVPTLVIAVLYVLGLFWLFLLGKSDGAIARLFSLVLAIGVPLLIAHAILRYNTARIQIADDHVRYHPGWPKRLPSDLPYALIETCRVRRGLSGRMFGGGTLEILLTTGQKIFMPDLENPESAKTALDARLFPSSQNFESAAEASDTSSEANSDINSASTM